MTAPADPRSRQVRYCDRLHGVEVDRADPPQRCRPQIFHRGSRSGRTSGCDCPVIGGRNSRISGCEYSGRRRHTKVMIHRSRPSASRSAEICAARPRAVQIIVLVSMRSPSAAVRLSASIEATADPNRYSIPSSVGARSIVAGGPLPGPIASARSTMMILTLASVPRIPAHAFWE